ncbi:MAG: hypothetical protein Q8J72_05355 [Rhodocyclaceae bacterium]|nr:hypothetical protein [Rhodocyclaceae bacterium]
MKIEGGFWDNFKAAFGLGLGGGLGAGIGWRVGDYLGSLVVRFLKWGALFVVLGGPVLLPAFCSDPAVQRMIEQAQTSKGVQK